MDLTQRDRLSKLVEELTTSGQLQLNQDKMKEIKKICKYVTRDGSDCDTVSCVYYMDLFESVTLINAANSQQMLSHDT